MTPVIAKEQIVIVDFGMGNLRSLESKLAIIGFTSKISSSPQEIRQATRLILPGVGNFAKGMQNIIDRELKEVLTETVVKNRVPILGICLGMQLLGLQSEEGNVSGLGWLPYHVQRFQLEGVPSMRPLRVPHVGWNQLELTSKTCPLFRDIDPKSSFYFTHSFHASFENAANANEVAVAYTEHGIRFPSVIRQEHIFGTQFHPEKSRMPGLKLIENFLRCEC